VLIEGYILAKQLAGLFGTADFPFKGVPAGSVLGKDERYVWFAVWPEWDPQKRNPPAPGVLRAELAAIGVDMATVSEGDRTMGGVLEVLRAGVTVPGVQAVFARHGGVAIVCYESGAVPELSWDALEAYQKAVDGIHDFDPWWWTTTVATWTLVAVLVVGAVALAYVLWRRKSS
jgi:hypothetical protein